LNGETDFFEKRGGEKSKQPGLFLGERAESLFIRLSQEGVPENMYILELYPCDVNNIKRMLVCNNADNVAIAQILAMSCLQLCLFTNDKKHNFGGYFI